MVYVLVSTGKSDYHQEATLKQTQFHPVLLNTHSPKLVLLAFLLFVLVYKLMELSDLLF